MKSTCHWILTRRTFLQSTAAATVAGAMRMRAATPSQMPLLRFGIFADSHYADVPDRGDRRYRKSLVKMRECVELMNQQQVDFLIELGDFKDQASPPVKESTLQFLAEAESVFSEFNGPRYHVLGNHDVDSISKAQFLRHAGNSGIPQGHSYYSFDRNGIHCVVLDANFRADATPYDSGNFNWKDACIPPGEMEWLRQDLARSDLPVICFIHQEIKGGGVPVVNAGEVSRLLEASGRTLAVFQGHHHAGAYELAGNIHYYTLRCMVEGAGPEDNAYAVVSVYADNSITVDGYRRAVGRAMRASVAGRVPHADDRDVICLCKYNVDQSGRTDETAKFRMAVDDVRRDPEKRVLLIPCGKYRISRPHHVQGVILYLEEGAELLSQ